MTVPQSNIFIIIACLLFLAGCALRKGVVTSQAEQKSYDLLLIAYDNGDGRAFRSLLPELTNRNISWHVIAFGPAADLFEPGENITILNQQVSAQEALKWKENRRQQLPDQVIQLLLDKIKPRILITGMAHAEQARLTSLWWQQGVWTIAFYDNYESPSEQGWVQPWLEQKPPVEEIFVPSARLSKSFPESISRSKGISVVAHPTLKEWDETIKRSHPEVLRESLKLGSQPVVLIAGGYDKGYQNSLTLMAEAASLRPNLQWLVVPHPRNKGEFERALLNSDNPPPFQLIENEPTVRLAGIADLVMTHRSTVGWLTSQLGIPTLFVRPEAPPEHLANNRITMVNSVSSLLNGIHRELDNPSHSSIPARIKELPHISDIIQKRLNPGPGKPMQIDYVEDVGQ
ncbi:hypothetical protein M3P05_11330 [Sansalvadorimonas sp. 2012CJ34-2]|uniref:UDP-N-acetylglucosamine:LPS N-acetylglucosamine transferase n=1 Tax=Parendozoicomonas callyspongiae TaxID=2942213 RepID=A0ABT0PGJ6_9GAMM|nr:hypothetical protein [Sansalvadorimonas sp. 2012CJ34-2]MCL6270514.1 hypothetical protein [Sansalvadorimonas sp. 2012CJ34-2]